MNKMTYFDENINKCKSYILVKKFDDVGCVAVLMDVDKIWGLQVFLEEYLDDGNTQVVITNSPEVYTEYAPYDIKKTLKEFLNEVLPDE